MIAKLKITRRAPGVEPGIEQRTWPRRKVSMPAKVAIAGGAVDCTIRDISRSGLQLHALSILRLPDEVDLLILSEGILIHAERVWARFPLSGLRVLEVHDIRQSKNPQALALREAWESWPDR